MTQSQGGRFYWLADDVQMFGRGLVLLMLFALVVLWLVAEATVLSLHRGVFPNAGIPSLPHNEAEETCG